MKKKILKKKKFLTSYILTLLTVSIVLFSGCGVNTNEQPSPTSTATNEQPGPASTATNEQPGPANAATYEQTKALTLYVVNLCGVSFGSFSIIDPSLNEQSNLGIVENETVMEISLDWPTDVDELQWAIYNTDGDLYLEGSTNLSGANENVTITFSGDGEVSDVEVLLDSYNQLKFEKEQISN